MHCTGNVPMNTVTVIVWILCHCVCVVVVGLWAETVRGWGEEAPAAGQPVGSHLVYEVSWVGRQRLAFVLDCRGSGREGRLKGEWKGG